MTNPNTPPSENEQHGRRILTVLRDAAEQSVTPPPLCFHCLLVAEADGWVTWENGQPVLTVAGWAEAPR